MKTILCFGDSNTWGSVPHENRRFDENERWPALLRRLLPADWVVIEEGQNGRTTVHDDPIEGEKNGLRYLLPCLESHIPDLVVILLGTNDLKYRFGLSADDISRGAARLAALALGFRHRTSRQDTQVLLIAPPPIREVEGFGLMFAGGEAKSQGFAQCYALRSAELGCAFLDAGTVVESCPDEGIHWDVVQHRQLAESVAVRVREMLAGD